MSTTTIPPAGPQAPLSATQHYVESAQKRRSRLSIGALIVAVGLLLVYLAFSTSGEAHFALSNVFDEVQLPTISVPGLPVVVTTAVLCLLAGACSRCSAPAFDAGRRSATAPVPPGPAPSEPATPRRSGRSGSAPR